MGHTADSERSYRRLQRRLDQFLTGAPDSPTFQRVLKLLFSPEEAELARRLPGMPTPLPVLSRRLGIPQDELSGKLTQMAERGVILDIERDGERYFALPPVVIGFFEFVFMRARDDLPMAELAQLFEQYMLDDDRFVRSVFAGETQLGRSFVHEEALPEGDHTEILDWERASEVVRSASAVAVSLCACRHKASHLGEPCEHPMENCLSLNYAAETLVHNGAARALTIPEAMDLLEEVKQAGLAQTGDNVQRKVTFICNCCGCCCGFMQGIRRFNLCHAVVTSNWLMDVDADACKGCGKCVKACPVSAIELVEGEGSKKRARPDVELCLGCGVCYSACTFGAISMRSRERRVHTPETIFDRTIAMAIERGKLASLLFDDPTRLSHRALRRVLRILEKSPPWKAMMAVKPLRSVFLNALVKGARRQAGTLGEELV